MDEHTCGQELLNRWPFLNLMLSQVQNQHVFIVIRAFHELQGKLQLRIVVASEVIFLLQM
jgi:hypothetical protein